MQPKIGRDRRNFVERHYRHGDHRNSSGMKAPDHWPGRARFKCSGIEQRPVDRRKDCESVKRRCGGAA
ncbi:MAG TPA: hypothetical protein VKH35_01885 [Thermoanaerobaculia bacterium]|nr:hypothetical protein [Thermoanaerobaculia bacterium]